MQIEKISIHNFGGIDSIDFEFKSINVLIGPQGSGKSITVKLLYFFKSFFGEVVRSIFSDESKRELDKIYKEKFITFFPKESWPKGDFEIIYSTGETSITVRKTNHQLDLNYSENLKKTIVRARKLYTEEKKREDPERSSFSFQRQLDKKIKNFFKQELGAEVMNSQYFVPAGRSFFANIQKSIFSFLSDNRSLDPFLIEFGSFYENLKRIRYNNWNEPKQGKEEKDFDDIITEILQSTYVREKEKDFLVHRDNRKVNLSNASSGQQETLPLVIILKSLNQILFPDAGATIYIEEPEAHLFPTAQNAIVKLLARTFNHKRSKFQIIVTTHSPYILSSFNNLLQAGRLSKLKPHEQQRIAKIVPLQEHLDPELTCAYSLFPEEKKDLIDEESKLISATILDGVSNEINIEFSNLIDIEFDDAMQN